MMQIYIVCFHMDILIFNFALACQNSFEQGLGFRVRGLGFEEEGSTRSLMLHFQ